MGKYVEGDYVIKANEEAFSEFKHLAYRVDYLKSFVQNDAIIDQDSLEDFDKRIEEIVSDLQTLTENVLQSIKRIKYEDI